MEAPKCRLCEKNHWAREGCDFGNKLTKLEQTGKVLADYAKRNIQREGRRVLKGSTGQPAKPTRTASAERNSPKQKPTVLLYGGPAGGSMASSQKAPKKKKAKKAAKKKSKPPQESTR